MTDKYPTISADTRLGRKVLRADVTPDEAKLAAIGVQFENGDVSRENVCWLLNQCEKLSARVTADTDKCVQCGRPESEHHFFDPGDRPAGCVCGLKNTEPAPCDAFEDQVPYFSWCGRCMHARDCHVMAEPEHECRCAEVRTNLSDASHGGGYYDSRGYGHCIFCGHDEACHKVKR